MSLLFLFIVLAVVCFGLFFFALQPSDEQKALQRRIHAIRNPRRSSQDGEGQGEDGDAGNPALSAWFDDELKRYRWSRGIDRLLLQAGSSATGGELVLHGVAAGVTAILTTFIIFHSLPISAIFGAVAFFLPVPRLIRTRARRVAKATEELPDTAELMSRALRSGHSVTQAIELLAEKGPPILGAEFARVFQQQKLGVALRDVLVEMATRVPSRDLQFLVTAILVQRETGGDLAAILDRTAQVLRERIQLQAQVQIHTAQGRLTGWILSLMPVVLLGVMMLFSPDYARCLFDDPIGQKLLLAGVCFIAVGAGIIRQIVGVTI